jgi:hypothetical protein
MEAKQQGVTAAGGAVPDDPVTGRPVKPVTPGQRYSDLVRDMLMEAMVKQGYVLPIAAGQHLVVQVTPIDVAVTNVLERNRSRKLNLVLKGEDLEAFRLKRLTEDELRLRIVDRRY